MDRIKSLIERIRKDLTDEGIFEEKIRVRSETGPGDFESYFDFMIERKLQGLSEPGTQNLWNEFKAQLNDREATIRKAAEDYRRLETRYRGLRSDFEEILKESHKTNPK